MSLAGGKALHSQLLVSIVDSISACHAEDRVSTPRRGELVLFCCRTTHPKVSGAARGHRRSSASTSARAKANALAGNRTRVNCLEGSYARHYTTNATIPQRHYTTNGGRRLARSVRMLEAHESLTGLEELKRSLFGPGTKDQGLDPVTYEKALSFHAG